MGRKGEEYLVSNYLLTNDTEAKEVPNISGPTDLTIFESFQAHIRIIYANKVLAC
jgi:hypothetical protein